MVKQIWYCVDDDTEFTDKDSAQSHLDSNPGHHIVNGWTGGG